MDYARNQDGRIPVCISARMDAEYGLKINLKLSSGLRAFQLGFQRCKLRKGRIGVRLPVAGRWGGAAPLARPSPVLAARRTIAPLPALAIRLAVARPLVEALLAARALIAIAFLPGLAAAMALRLAALSLRRRRCAFGGLCCLWPRLVTPRTAPTLAGLAVSGRTIALLAVAPAALPVATVLPVEPGGTPDLDKLGLGWHRHSFGGLRKSVRRRSLDRLWFLRSNLRKRGPGGFIYDNGGFVRRRCLSDRHNVLDNRLRLGRDRRLRFLDC
jgi:hypothetical protein